METYGWFKREFENAQNTFEYKLESLELHLTEKILAMMEERGINQTELAKKMGKSKANISKLFRNGSNLTLKSLLAIAEAIDCMIHIEIIKNTSNYQTESYSASYQGFSYHIVASDDYRLDNEDFKYAANCY